MTQSPLRPLLQDMGYQHAEQKGVQTWLKTLPKHELRTRIILKADKLHIDVDRLSLASPLSPSVSMMSATWKVASVDGEVMATLEGATMSGDVLPASTSNEELLSHFSRYVFSAPNQPSFEGMGDSLLKPTTKVRVHV